MCVASRALAFWSVQHQTKARCITGDNGSTSAFEIHLAYVTAGDRHPLSKKLKEPAPGRLPAPFCLIPRAVCSREGRDGLWMSKCKKDQGFTLPQKRSYTVIRPQRRLKPRMYINKEEKSGVT